MNIKRFFNCILSGMGVTIGSVIAYTGIKVIKDPVKKANVKRRIKKIKDAVVNKD